MFYNYKLTFFDNKKIKVSIKMNMEESNEVKVKNEPVYDSQSIPETIETTSNSVKKEPIDIEMQTYKSQVEVKAEEKFSTTEEFANKASIAFLNEETTSTSSDNNPIANQATTSKTNKTRNRKTNNLIKSK